MVLVNCLAHLQKRDRNRKIVIDNGNLCGKVETLHGWSDNTRMTEALKTDRGMVNNGHKL